MQLVAALLDLWVRGELSANKDQKHQAVTQKEGGEARVTAASITIVAAATAAIANDAQRDAATAAAAAAATTTPAAAVSRTAATASITTVEAAAASSTAAAAAITSDTQHAAAATATTTPATEGENIQHDDAAAVADLIDEKNKRLKRCMFGLSLWIILLASRSAHHAWIWRSEEPVFENAIRTCPRSAKVLNNHALGMLNATHAREAQRELAVAIEVFPEYANAHYNKALSHFLLGEHQLAVKHFGISLRSDTCNLMAYSYLGQSELMLFEKARTMPVDGVSDEGRNITSVTTTATTNFQLSKDSLANRAAAHLDHAIAHGLESPSTFHYRGSLALALNKPQLAAYYLEKALGAHGKAVEEKQLIRSKIVRQYSDDLNVAFTRNQLGLAYKAMDMPHEAEQEFLRGLQHEPNSYELLANLGTIFLENNELDLALVWLQKALELNPNSRDLLNNMGVVEEKRGAYHRARKYFLRALEQSPHHQNPTVVNNIKRVEQALQGMY